MLKLSQTKALKFRKIDPVAFFWLPIISVLGCWLIILSELVIIVPFVFLGFNGPQLLGIGAFALTASGRFVTAKMPE